MIYSHVSPLGKLTSELHKEANVCVNHLIDLETLAELCALKIAPS